MNTLYTHISNPTMQMLQQQNLIAQAQNRLMGLPQYNNGGGGGGSAGTSGGPSNLAHLANTIIELD